MRLLYLSWQQDLVARTERSSRTLMYCASHLHHLHPLPLFPPPDKKEEQHCYLSEQEVRRQETLEKTSILLLRSILFIDGET